MVYKNLAFMADAQIAGLVVGARAPVILTSRADTPAARRFSAAAAVLYAERWRGSRHPAAGNRGVIGDERGHHRLQRGLHQREVRRLCMDAKGSLIRSVTARSATCRPTRSSLRRTRSTNRWTRTNLARAARSTTAPRSIL